MDNEKLIKNWHKAIIKAAESRLGRKLSEHERVFITRCGGFIALEMIEDTVKSLVADELEEYLNSK